jgi:hypothetical protein
MNGLVESYQLNEGIIEDLRFGINSSGNIVTVNEGSVEAFDKDELQSAVLSKFKDILGHF